jgi:hypothetical protein
MSQPYLSSNYQAIAAELSDHPPFEACSALLYAIAPSYAFLDEGGLAPEPIMTFVPLDETPSPSMNLNSDAKMYQLRVRLKQEKLD